MMVPEPIEVRIVDKPQGEDLREIILGWIIVWGGAYAAISFFITLSIRAIPLPILSEKSVSLGIGTTLFCLLLLAHFIPGYTRTVIRAGFGIAYLLIGGISLPVGIYAHEWSIIYISLIVFIIGIWQVNKYTPFFKSIFKSIIAYRHRAQNVEKHTPPPRLPPRGRPGKRSHPSRDRGHHGRG